MADLYTGAGNAQAAGTVGSANAWTGALGGVANGISSAYGLKTLKDLYGNKGAFGNGSFLPSGMSYNMNPSPAAAYAGYTPAPDEVGL
jgi:hypothetical protein